MNGLGPCRACGGSGTVPKRTTIEVSIPAGVRDGSRVRVAGKGQPGVDGGPPGDVFLKVNLRKHPRFELQGSTLRTSIDVPLYTAVLGGEAIVQTLEGKRIAVTIQPESQNGQVIRLRNQGWPDKPGSSARGDLLVKVQVQLPADLDDEERALFEQLRERRERVGSGATA